jgi:hypothetical protein
LLLRPAVEKRDYNDSIYIKLASTYQEEHLQVQVEKSASALQLPRFAQIDYVHKSFQLKYTLFVIRVLNDFIWSYNTSC